MQVYIKNTQVQVEQQTGFNKEGRWDSWRRVGVEERWGLYDQTNMTKHRLGRLWGLAGSIPPGPVSPPDSWEASIGKSGR